MFSCMVSFKDEIGGVYGLAEELTLLSISLGIYFFGVFMVAVRFAWRR